MDPVEVPRYPFPQASVASLITSPTPDRLPAAWLPGPHTSSKYRQGNTQCKKQTMNRVIRDTHNTKIKIQSAPPHPFNLNFMYLYHLGGAKNKKKTKNKLSSSASWANCDRPWAALLAGWAWLQGTLPGPPP